MRQIGADVGHKGIADDALIVLLHQLSRPTFFTRDDDFYQKALCHPAYCLVPLAVGQYEVASFVRRFLRQPQFGIYIRRRGSTGGPQWVTRLASQCGSRGRRFLA